MDNKINYEMIKFINGDFELDVTLSLTEETIWLSQDDIGKLFGRARNTINEHISKIYSNNELEEKSTCRLLRQVQYKGTRSIQREKKFYNLDLIILIGYRVNSKKASLFRKWVGQVLKEYLLKGYIINENRTIINNENFNNLILVVNNILANQIDFNNRLLKIEDKV
ncbi:MAG: virulence RhuM family protein [Bacilli bacterium]|nr:virulence RhuM family protein [Bacilli bacterium]